MDKILDLVKNRRYLLFAIAGVLIIILILYFSFGRNYDNEEIIDSSIGVIDEIDVNDEEISNVITIDIKGEVLNPGVYDLPIGARVIDAIEISGGVTKNADTLNLNLSKVLNDQNVIIINSKENKEIIKYIEKECNCLSVNDACINNEDIVTDDTVNNSNVNSNSSKISINTATKEELMNLKGIGESKATDIINYRNSNGLFKNIEDIKKVSGIGDKVFEKIKDQITT